MQASFYHHLLMYRLCVVPKNWTSSALVPVPKSKGSLEDPDNFREIAVSSVIGKQFSICLLKRIDDWAELFNIRASGRFGFRWEWSTADASLVLSSLIDVQIMCCA